MATAHGSDVKSVGHEASLNETETSQILDSKINDKFAETGEGACSRRRRPWPPAATAHKSPRIAAQPVTLIPPVVARVALVTCEDPDPKSGALYSPFPWHKHPKVALSPGRSSDNVNMNGGDSRTASSQQLEPSATIDTATNKTPQPCISASVTHPKQTHKDITTNTYVRYEQMKTCPNGIVPHYTTLQYSVHTPGRHLARDIALVFPSLTPSQKRGPDHRGFGSIESLVVVPTFQKSIYDLVGITPQTAWERNMLLEYFMEFGNLFCKYIREKGYWADMTDPASGFPVHSDRGASLYPDVDGCSRLLKYTTHLAGCCRVLQHPVWGTHSYPATMFACAPIDVVRGALEYAVSYGRGIVEGSATAATTSSDTDDTSDGLADATLAHTPATGSPTSHSVQSTPPVKTLDTSIATALSKLTISQPHSHTQFDSVVIDDSDSGHDGSHDGEALR